MPSSTRNPALVGAAYAVAAFGSWGVFPLYFRALRAVPPVEVLCHRVVWSALLLSIVMGLSRRQRSDWACLRRGRVWLTLLATTILIACNWLVYIWAVASGRVLEASLGYYINPLVNVALGGIFLRERLSAIQKVAVGLAASGVLVLTLWLHVVPWLPLTLACSFAFYGLLRKTVAVEGVMGLWIETGLLLAPSVGYLCLLGSRAAGHFGTTPTLTTLLVAAGPITAIPLLWFTNAARRLSLAAVGFFQYLSPTGQFLLALFVFGESFRVVHAVTFALIWTGVALFCVDAVRRLRVPERLQA